MTQETLEKAKKNRKLRSEKLSEYNKVSGIHDNISDNDILWLDFCGNSYARIVPTTKECRDFLRIVRDRLDAEISDLDKEFKEL